MRKGQRSVLTFRRFNHDIGLGEFDHHQPDNECRDNGIPYAAFGKLWRAFAPGRFSEYVVEKMDEDFISKLDASDNGLEKSQLAEAVKIINPAWNSKRNPTEAFEEALIFASKVLEREIEAVQAEEEALDVVKQAMKTSDASILVLPYYCPWAGPVSNDKSIKFVVYPSNMGGYCVHTVPESVVSRRNRVDFPEKWLGHPEKEIGMTFCHPGNFLASTVTLEQAVNVAKIAMTEAEKNPQKS